MPPDTQTKIYNKAVYLTGDPFKAEYIVNQFKKVQWITIPSKRKYHKSNSIVLRVVQNKLSILFR